MNQFAIVYMVNLKGNISFKCTVWYQNFNEEGKYVCYCTSNVS